MQAENSSEGKKPKKGGQYPTPPARSKASRLGIAKECINFLLEHNVYKFTSKQIATGQFYSLVFLNPRLR